MPVDFAKIDKKKAGIVVLAVFAGLMAVVLTNAYINKTVEQRSASEEVQYLMREVKKLGENNNVLAQQQQALAEQVQQQIQGLAQRQAPAPEPKGEGRPQSLALKTPEGKRAITVRIQTLAAVGGLLNPGDFVDILAHLSVPNESKDAAQTQKTTVTLFQNIQILAIGPNTDTLSNFEAQHQSTTLNITLAVDPREAELITFAENHGTLQLALRSPVEKEAYKLEAADWQTFTQYLEDVQGVKIEPPKPPAEVKKEEEKSNIKIYRGGQ